MKGWPSGRRHPPTKRAWVLTTHLGFESLALRQSFGAEESMVIQGTVNPPPLARLVRSQDAPPVRGSHRLEA